MGQNNENNILSDWLDLQFGVPGPRRWYILPVLSSSMLPSLAPGGTISIHRLSGKECRPGQIIVFIQNRRLIAHRLILRVKVLRRCYFFEKGDANPYGHWIASTRVIGIVSHAENARGRVVDLTAPSERRRARACARRQLCAIPVSALRHALLRFRKALKKARGPGLFSTKGSER